MSLKAKLEAVVYAAEEPVTLAQLAIIFADEVLPASDAGPVVAPSEAEGGEQPAEEQISLSGLASATEQPGGEQKEQSTESPAAEAPISPEGAVADAGEGEEKKVARLRDRRIRLELQKVLDELIADYARSERGMEIREIAGGYRMATKPEYHDAVRGFVKSLKPPMKLSLQALETLAVIAYKQPVTAPEVSEIRGVDSGGVLGGLVSRKLITTAGRKPVIGRPILYKTTKEFLLRFGLKDVNDLPSMEEFEKMAGELAESEAEGEAQDAANSASDLPFSGESAESSRAEQASEESSAPVMESVEAPAEAADAPRQTESTEEPTVLASPGVEGES